jgi:hypothetical protein
LAKSLALAALQQDVEHDSVRDALHRIADLIANLLEQNPVASPPARRECPKRPAAKRRHRRAPPMPPVIATGLAVSNANRERARQALLRRGVNVRAKEEP